MKHCAKHRIKRNQPFGRIFQKEIIFVQLSGFGPKCFAPVFIALSRYATKHGEDTMTQIGLSNDGFPLLTRKDGVQFIRDELGIPLSSSLLDKKCMSGEGPDVAGYWGKRELYTRQQLREWALKLFTNEPANLGSTSRQLSTDQDSGNRK
jgi:hypothetical protein